uniref:Uncharacterized protein n=1 Tax=Anguilla anguilla TaxID=7936 RepID=A0A0E9QNW3_ANGAN
MLIIGRSVYSKKITIRIIIAISVKLREVCCSAAQKIRQTQSHNSNSIRTIS